MALKKIMHLLYSNSYGGAERVAMDIIEETNNIYSSIYVSKKGEINDILAEKNIQYQLFEKISFFKIAAVIKKNEIDIIHAHDFRASIFASFFFKHCKIVSHIHQSPKWLEKKTVKGFIYRIILKKISEIILVSPEIQNSFLFNGYEEKITILPNYVKKTNLKTVTANKRYDFAFVGRLEKEKRPQKFLEFFEQFKNIREDVSAIVIGDGTQMDEVRNYITAKNLNILQTGFLKSPQEKMVEAKFMLITSEKEGFGISAVESMQLGVPLITKKIGGVTDLIDEKNGIPIDNFSIDELKKINMFLDDSEKYLKMVENARELGDSFSDIKKWLSIVRKVYI